MKPKIAALLAILIAVLACAGAVVTGLLIQPLLPDFDGLPLLGIIAAAFALLCLVNRLSAFSFARSHFGMEADEYERLMDDHRAACDRDPAAVLRELGNLTTMPLLLLVLYYILVIAMAVALGLSRIAPVFHVVGGVLLAHWLFMPIYLRLCVEDDHLYREELVPADKMPALHELARKAAHVVGLRGEIRIELTGDADLSTRRFGHTYVFFLGARTLAVATEAELYAAFLRLLAYHDEPMVDHEFALFWRLSNMGTAKPRPLTWVFDLYFSSVDASTEWYAPLFQAALSRKVARRAAELCVSEHCADAALSLMAKQELWDYFSHEWYMQVKEPIYAYARSVLEYEYALNDAFRKAMMDRYPVWRRLLPRKLPPASLVGPTFADMVAMMGLSAEDLPAALSFPDDTTPIGAEAIRPALSVVSDSSRYETERQSEYLHAKQIIDDWEASDRNRPVYELSPVLNAYLALHRLSDVEALCDSILAEDPNFAHALYFKGQCQLTRYEAEGIDAIYRAIDLNKNFMTEGFNQVHTYCRIMGLTEEMEAFSRREEAVVNAHGAEHDDAGSLTVNDDLVPETELGEELPAILAYMSEAGGGCVENIFLVRKVISEDFFTSAFVIDFSDDAREEDMQAAYSAIFYYLDASEWQFSLFLLNRETVQAVMKVPNSLVWQRKK